MPEVKFDMHDTDVQNRRYTGHTHTEQKDRHSTGEACTGQMWQRQGRTYKVKIERHAPTTGKEMVGGKD